MRYVKGLTSREIAELLNITEYEVRKLLGRAKRRLRAEM
ncbi:MAG: sigma factor-like helix-turn-helix DNA-binding protein [Christensenellales bacterium]